MLKLYIYLFVLCLILWFDSFPDSQVVLGIHTYIKQSKQFELQRSCMRHQAGESGQELSESEALAPNRMKSKAISGSLFCLAGLKAPIPSPSGSSFTVSVAWEECPYIFTHTPLRD